MSNLISIGKVRNEIKKEIAVNSEMRMIELWVRL